MKLDPLDPPELLPPVSHLAPAHEARAVRRLLRLEGGLSEDLRQLIVRAFDSAEVEHPAGDRTWVCPHLLIANLEESGPHRVGQLANREYLPAPESRGAGQP